MIKFSQCSSFRYLATSLVAILIITMLEAVPVPVHAATTPCSVTFASQVNYSVGTNPYATAIGDFNADGKSDLATANDSSSNVSILLNNGNGTFQTAVNYTTGSGPRWITIGDYNGDSKLDLATANSGGSNVSILLGNGDGTFQARVNFTAGDFPFYIVKGDFNADGKLDLVTANYFGRSVSMLLGNGNGTFQSPVNYAITGLEGMTVGDFNADGKLDLATANFDQSNTVSILLGNGDGTLQTPVNYAVGNQPRGITTGDLNADGKLDLAVSNFSSNNVSILLGNGDGTFQSQVTYSVGTSIYRVTLGDFNGDGKLDLATTNYGNGAVGILLGNGDGTFQAQVTFATGSTLVLAEGNDLNGDGQLDLVATKYGSNNAGILLNTGSCEIDVQGNSVSIASGDTTPSTSDHTDFGSVDVSNGTVVRTFTIQNTSTGALTLNSVNPVSVSGTNAGNFTVTQPAVSSVAAGGSTTFQITFDPSAVGVRTATVSIANGDSDEGSYTFALQGGGTAALTSAQLTQLSGYSQTCATATTPYVKQCTINFTLRNISGGALQVKYYQLTALSSHVDLLNGTPNPGGVGAQVTAPGSVASSATFPASFTLGLKSNTAYTIRYKVYGYAGAVVAAGANDAQAVELGEYEVTVPAEDATSSRVFLPLVVQ